MMTKNTDSDHTTEAPASVVSTDGFDPYVKTSPYAETRMVENLRAAAQARRDLAVIQRRQDARWRESRSNPAD